jgi:hypothetical protein
METKMNASKDIMAKLSDLIQQTTGCKSLVLFVCDEEMPCLEKEKNGKCAVIHKVDCVAVGIREDYVIDFVRQSIDAIKRTPPKGSTISPFSGLV